MTHKARCPACSTVFAISSEALGASGGWVRCGRCSEVFDAVVHRYQGGSADPDSLAERLALQLQTPVQQPAGHGAKAANRPSRIEVTSTPDATSPNLPTDADTGANAFAPTVLADFPTKFLAANDPLPTPPVKSPRRKNSDATHASKREKVGRAGSDIAIDTPRAKAESAPFTRPVEPVVAHTSPSVTPPLLSEFVRRGFDNVDRQPLQLWLWTLLAIVSLSGLLAMQFALTMRHELAAHYPASKATLTALCKPFGCSVNPLAALDAITIDASSFQELPSNSSSLNFELKWSVTNHALYPVARPAFELTLNDVLDRPLIRRVLLPTELGAVEPELAAEGTWTGAMNLRVQPPNAGVKISGYRLTAFYP
jgi:predicted Zn finger-like uncharacterized protein